MTLRKNGWVARDKHGRLNLYLDESPYKREYAYEDDGSDVWHTNGDDYREIDPKLFPSVKWEDSEPTEVEIILKLKGR